MTMASKPARSRDDDENSGEASTSAHGEKDDPVRGALRVSHHSGNGNGRTGGRDQPPVRGGVVHSAGEPSDGAAAPGRASRDRALESARSSRSAATADRSLGDERRSGVGSSPGADPDRSRPRRHYGGNWCCRSLYELNRLRLLCGRLVNKDRVQLFVVFLITVNAIMMGIATFDFVSTNPEVQSKFEYVDNIFLIVFTFELGLQFLYHGLRLFLDGWLLFDFVVIVMSWAFAEAQIIRAFRIFRALRLVTRVRILRNLVTALFSVMPNMASIMSLLFLLMYIFSVMVTTLFSDMYEKGQLEYNYFGRLDMSFFTLFQMMTFDAWADVAREVMGTYPWAWIVFIVYVVISGFVIVNLIIAVICDAIAALHDDERAKLHGWRVDDSVSDEGADEEGRTSLLRAAANGEGEAVVYTLNSEVEGNVRVRMSPEQVQGRLQVMDDQIKQSAKIQEQTALTIEYLIQQLQKIPSPVPC